MSDLVNLYDLIEGTGIKHPPDSMIYESYENMITFMDDETGELIYIDTLH